MTAIAFLFANSAAADGHVTPITGVNFPKVNTIEATILRGSLVFQNYCILCHGPNADGKGRAAKLYDPKPSNLKLSDKNEKYKELIIRQGGGAIGRSEFMPPWEKELTNEQISDVVIYLQFLLASDAAPQ